MAKTIEVKFKPTDKQKEAHALTDRYILYGGAIRGGKTVWLCNEAIDACLRLPNNAVLVCRQKLDDFKKTTLQTLLDFLPRQAIVTHHQTDRYITLINGSIIYYGGLGDDDRTRERLGGLELGCFCVDQAEELSETQFNLLCTRLTRNIPNIHYHGFMTANPQPGWLRDRFIDNPMPDHKFIPALPRDNPHLPKNYEAEQRKNLPGWMVRQFLDGFWDVDASANYLIPYSQIREAVGRGLEAEGDKVAGVDIARMGNDESVFILRHGNKVIHIESWSHQDTVFSAGKISRLMKRFEPDVTNIDSIGIGAGVFDPLSNEGYDVKAINVGEKPLDKESYVNKRAEYFALLQKKFQDGEIDIPDDPKLLSQLSAIKYDFRGTRMIIQSKEMMRKKGGKSPDYADALMLCFIGSDVPESSVSDKIPVTHWG